MARYGKKASQKVKRAMHERKRGKLKSGRSGKRVRSRDGYCLMPARARLPSRVTFMSRTTAFFLRQPPEDSSIRGFGRSSL
jgi:Family of unknown function (DUF6496)